jgi:hypothetical protein
MVVLSNEVGQAQPGECSIFYTCALPMGRFKQRHSLEAVQSLL